MREKRREKTCEKLSGTFPNIGNKKQLKQTKTNMKPTTLMISAMIMAMFTASCSKKNDNPSPSNGKVAFSTAFPTWSNISYLEGDADTTKIRTVSTLSLGLDSTCGAFMYKNVVYSIQVKDYDVKQVLGPQSFVYHTVIKQISPASNLEWDGGFLRVDGQPQPLPTKYILTISTSSIAPFTSGQYEGSFQ